MNKTETELRKETEERKEIKSVLNKLKKQREEQWNEAFELGKKQQHLDYKKDFLEFLISLNILIMPKSVHKEIEDKIKELSDEETEVGK